MFYSENIIKSKLSCPLCKAPFDEPRSLACGNSICNNCSREILDTNPTEFKCRLCETSHQIPSEGFPLNKSLIDIISIKPFEISRGDLANRLKSTVNSIRNRLRKLELALNNGADVIHEYCSELRRLSQLAAETNIQEIQKINDDIIKQIDEFEVDRVKRFNLNRDAKLSHVAKLVNELVKFENESKLAREYLNQPDLNDNTTLKYLNRTSDLESALILKEREVERLVFNDYLMLFKPNELIRSIGTLKVIQSSEISFNDLETAQIEFNLSENNIKLDNVAIRFLDNGDYIISYEKEAKLYISIFDHLSKKELRKRMVGHIEENDSYRIIALRGKIYIQLIKAVEDYLDAEHKNRVLIVYDCDLKEIISTDKFRTNLVDVTDEYLIFRRDKEEKHCYAVYNHELELVKKVGQFSSENEPFYFPEKAFRIVNQNKRYYLYYESNDKQGKLRITDELSGLLVKEISTGNNLEYLKVNSFGDILMINRDNCLNIFNENGELTKQVKLVGFPSSFYSDFFVAFNKKGELHLFNFDNRDLYYSTIGYT